MQTFLVTACIDSFDVNIIFYIDFFFQDLKVHTEESLQKIVERLEIGYSIRQFQEYPPMALLNLKIDTPFTLITRGKSFEEARNKVVLQAFEMMQEFMKIKISINVCSDAY